MTELTRTIRPALWGSTSPMDLPPDGAAPLGVTVRVGRESRVYAEADRPVTVEVLVSDRTVAGPAGEPELSLRVLDFGGREVARQALGDVRFDVPGGTMSRTVELPTLVGPNVYLVEASVTWPGGRAAGRQEVAVLGRWPAERTGVASFEAWMAERPRIEADLERRPSDETTPQQRACGVVWRLAEQLAEGRVEAVGSQLWREPATVAALAHAAAELSRTDYAGNAWYGLGEDAGACLVFEGRDRSVAVMRGPDRQVVNEPMASGALAATGGVVVVEIDGRTIAATDCVGRRAGLWLGRRLLVTVSASPVVLSSRTLGAGELAAALRHAPRFRAVVAR